eukprot:g18270.t1
METLVGAMAPNTTNADHLQNSEYYADLVEKYVPDYTPTDYGVAMFLLVLSSGLIVVFSFALVMFFLKRNIYFFTLVCSTSTYGSRTIRLAVMFNTRARKVAPWLTSEGNHVAACLLLGVAALGFPLYDLNRTPDGPFHDLLFIARSTETFWRVSIGCQAVALAFWAFNCVGRPIHQLLRNPLESPDPRVAEALARRKKGGANFAMTRDCEASTASTEEADGDILEDLADPKNVLWIYEKAMSPIRAEGTNELILFQDRELHCVEHEQLVAKIPEVSAAFDEFSRKALCQESVLFLKTVTRYQSGSDRRWEASSADGSGDKYAAFTEIVLKFIMDGAPQEVNLSLEDKSAILRIREAGRAGFEALDDREKRFVFARAYAEVRFVVETNLMTRFVSSDGFKAAARLAGTAGLGAIGTSGSSLGTAKKRERAF